jgi:uncharacterized protein
MFAVKNRNVSLIRTFLKAGADINATTETGATALMIAADDAEVVKELISAGAKIDAVDKNGWTALFHAVEMNQLQKLETLLKHGADVNLKNKNGNTPLILAERITDSTQKQKVIKLLKKYGAK